MHLITFKVMYGAFVIYMAWLLLQLPKKVSGYIVRHVKNECQTSSQFFDDTPCKNRVNEEFHRTYDVVISIVGFILYILPCIGVYFWYVSFL